jgi:hypothetical protein
MPDNDINKYEKMSELIQGLLTGNLTEEEFQVLDRMMSNDPECLKYYIEYTTIWALLDETECLSNTVNLSEYNTMTTQVLRDQETAYRSQPRFIAEFEEENHSHPFRNWKSVSMFLSAAAVIFIILIIKFSSQKPYKVEIAAIVDQINTQWDTEIPLETGSRLGSNEMQFSLKEGVVKLQFNDNVNVMIEGPAVFKIDKTGLFLGYGNLYCRVSRSGLGFTVKTPSAWYVDLGTVFGIKSDMKGVSELHVFKGNVRMVTGLAGNSRASRVIQENKAVRYNTGDNLAAAIPIEQKDFVSYFDSKSEVILRGQNYIDLADIVGGGNGLGTGTDQKGINPVSGKPSGLIAGTQRSTNDYHLVVPSSPYIDGVFIPNGRTKQVVSSLGNVFEECPVTSGSCFNNIGYAMRSINSNQTPESHELFRSILLHANTGITFDLEAIRRLMPETGTIHFQSQIGIERMPFRPKASNADFWVLVDGKLRFKKTQVKHKSFYSVDVELSQSDRFLTLIVTDGGDPEARNIDGRTVNAIDSDWGMFAEPVLVAE